jgi:hypothetical protein
VSDDAGRVAADDPRSRFYVGTILRLHPGSRSGVVRSASGRDVPFVMSGVRFLGDGGFPALREGMEVGFDVGWTSHGVRVTTIRLFD